MRGDKARPPVNRAYAFVTCKCIVHVCCTLSMTLI